MKEIAETETNRILNLTDSLTSEDIEYLNKVKLSLLKAMSLVNGSIVPIFIFESKLKISKIESKLSEIL